MKVDKQEEITLKLNREEVNWLKRLVQNPVSQDPDYEEDPKDEEMRRKFWEALDRQRI